MACSKDDLTAASCGVKEEELRLVLFLIHLFLFLSDSITFSICPPTDVCFHYFVYISFVNIHVWEQLKIVKKIIGKIGKRNVKGYNRYIVNDEAMIFHSVSILHMR